MNAAASEKSIAADAPIGIGRMYGPISPPTNAIGRMAATTVSVARMVGLPTSSTARTASAARSDGAPMRIRTRDRLRAGPATVSQHTGDLGATQQNVSKHLGMLLQAGIVRREKRGNHALYSVADESVFQLCEQVCGGLRRRIAELDGMLPQVPSG